MPRLHKMRRRCPVLFPPTGSAAVGVFLVRTLPPEKSPPGGEQKKTSFFQTGKPNVADVEGGSRYFSEKFRQPALPLPAAAIIFLFSRFPCCGEFSLCLQKLPPACPVTAVLFFAALFRRLSHPKKLKQKREGKPGGDLPSLKTHSASAGFKRRKAPEQ